MHEWGICPCDERLTEATGIKTTSFPVAFKRTQCVRRWRDTMRSALFVVFDSSWMHGISGCTATCTPRPDLIWFDLIVIVDEIVIRILERKCWQTCGQEGGELEFEETNTGQRMYTKLEFSFRYGEGRSWLIIYFQMHPCIEAEEGKKKKNICISFQYLESLSHSKLCPGFHK